MTNTKRLQRYCSLALLLVLSFTLFSSQVNAVSDIGDNYHVYNEVHYPNLTSTAEELSQPYPIVEYTTQTKGLNIYPDSSFNGHSYKVPIKIRNGDESILSFDTDWTVAKNDNKFILADGKTASLRLDNCWYGIGLMRGTDGKMGFFQPKPEIDASIRVYGKNGESAYFPCDSDFDKWTSLIDFSATITAEFDIYKITFSIHYQFPDGKLQEYTAHHSTYDYALVDWVYLLVYLGDGPTFIGTANPGVDNFVEGALLQKTSESALFEIVTLTSTEADLDKIDGKMSGILEWLRSLWNGVTGIWDTLITGFENTWHAIEDGIASIGVWFEDLINYLLEMPAIIAEWIGSKIQALFVPDYDVVLDFKEAFDLLLQERFGAVYECVNLIFNFFSDLYVENGTGKIYLPKVTIPVGNDETFTFGGYEVEIVPDGFEWIAELIRATLSAIATLLFINGLRKRYDRVMGG